MQTCRQTSRAIHKRLREKWKKPLQKVRPCEVKGKRREEKRRAEWKTVREKGQPSASNKAHTSDIVATRKRRRGSRPSTDGTSCGCRTHQNDTRRFALAIRKLVLILHPVAIGRRAAIPCGKERNGKCHRRKTQQTYRHHLERWTIPLESTKTSGSQWNTPA